MASTTIKKLVVFKTAGDKTLYASAKTSAKTTKKNVNTTTKYNATKSSGDFYYISEFKKWVKKSTVKAVDEKTVTKGTSTTKYRFMNLNKRVYSYSSSTTTKESGSFKPEDKLYNVTKISDGRSYIADLKVWVKSSLLEKATETHAEETTKEKVAAAIKKQEQQAAINSFLSSLVDTDDDPLVSNGSDENGNSFEVNNMVGVWGIPYQFSKEVDPIVSGTTFGQYYADRVVSRMPLLVLSPGKVAFMKYANANDTDFVQSVIGAVAGGKDDSLSSYLQKPGKYYTFEYDNANYWDYVNTMNMACAIMLGIGDVTITYNHHTAKIKNYKWENATNAKFKNIVQSSDTFLTFFADSESTAGEDFSNTTQESMIASTLNKSSDLGKEIRFLIGENGAITDILDSNSIDLAIGAIDNLTSGLLGDGNIVSQLSREFAVIASGGRLIFPEIWGDSTYTKDFDVKFKLRCPCPNKVAWFFDICVPLNCLIALTLPRTPHGTDIAGQLLSSDITSNGYFSPFLVRGFYKGVSTVDMGIITSLRIDKGKEGSWTIDALPSEVDVSMTIKDLYNTMAMSKRQTDGGSQLVNNTQFLSYLAFNCGISINQPDIIKSTMLWGAIFTTSIAQNFIDTATLHNYWRSIRQSFSNKIVGYLSGITGF